jgi:hypothetical protein
MWMPIPLWLIGAILFVVQMSSTPPTFYKRLAAGLLAATSGFSVVFIVVMAGIGVSRTSLVGDESTIFVLIAIQVLLMAGFVAAADMAFRAAFGPLSWDLSKMRNLRGVHLGLNLAGVFVFPVFAVIGVPLTLAKVARHRHSNGKLFGWSVALGTISLLLIFGIILAASILSGIPPIDYGVDRWNPCRKRAVLQDMTNVTSTGNSTSTFVWDTTGNSTSGFVWDTTTTTWVWEDTRVCLMQSESSHARTSWMAMLGAAWDPLYYSRYFDSMIEQPDSIIAISVFSLITFLIHIAFIVVADRLILKNMEVSEQLSGVVASQAPSESSEALVHPCASCGAMLQFVRTGTTTQVQCYQCSAIVEFTTA